MKSRSHILSRPDRRLLAFLIFCPAFCASLARADETAERSAPRVERFSRGPVEVVITAEPPVVRFARDILLNVRVRAPSEVKLTLPLLEDCVKGFAVEGSVETERREEGGTTVLERAVRLVPLAALEHRIEPLVVEYVDHGSSPASHGWFATKPLVFERPVPGGWKPGSDIVPDLSPVRFGPPLRVVLSWAIPAVIAIAAFLISAHLLAGVRRRKLAGPVSPRERALDEIATLLEQGLIRRNLIKEFYMELAMIVRRCMEALYSIHAPKLTTQEFLTALGSDIRFGPEMTAKLKSLLEAADEVKFAAYRPPGNIVEKAADEARDCIETGDN